ncbi:MAG: thioredoxin fold domain-containing protein [Chthonomonadales bacterium]
MKRTVQPMMLAVILAASAHASWADGIKWAPSFEAAMRTARSTNKLVMVDFYTDWCGWCKKLDADTYTDANVVRLSTRFVPVKVNAEKEGVAVARKYGVQGYPTIMFLEGNGSVAAKIGGYLPPQQFAEKLTEIDEAHRELPVLAAKFKQNPRDAAVAAKLTSIYASKDDPAHAEATLAALEKADPDNTTGLLAPAFNKVGDLYQDRQQFPRAIALFKQAAAHAKKPYDAAYAHISIAVCYLSERNLSAAVPELEATIAVKDGPKDLHDQARQILAAVRKAQNQQRAKQ